MKSIPKYTAVAAIVLLLASCTEYQPVIKCTLNGTPVEIQGTVTASYINMGSYTRSVLIADGEEWDISIRFDSNTPGNYSCGLSGLGAIEVSDGLETYTTQETGGSGTIETVQAGNNFIEGYFHGSLWSGGVEMTVTEGMFSGRTF